MNTCISIETVSFFLQTYFDKHDLGDQYRKKGNDEWFRKAGGQQGKIVSTRQYKITVLRGFWSHSSSGT